MVVPPSWCPGDRDYRSAITPRLHAAEIDTEGERREKAQHTHHVGVAAPTSTADAPFEEPRSQAGEPYDQAKDHQLLRHGNSLRQELLARRAELVSVLC